jgi:hypothetical protein
MLVISIGSTIYILQQNYICLFIFTVSKSISRRASTLICISPAFLTCFNFTKAIYSAQGGNFYARAIKPRNSLQKFSNCASSGAHGG